MMGVQTNTSYPLKISEVKPGRYFRDSSGRPFLRSGMAGVFGGIPHVRCKRLDLKAGSALALVWLRADVNVMPSTSCEARS